jgi:hypothetical protein
VKVGTAWRVTFALAVASCAQFRTPESPFDARVPADKGAVERALRVGRAPPPADEIALMVSSNRDALRGVSLTTGTIWNLSHRVDAIAITQDSVLLLGDEELLSVSLSNGEKRFRRAVGPLVMVGAAGGGDLTAVVLRTRDSSRTDLLALNHRGSVLQQWETEERLGTPAVFGPYLWVPWRDTFVSALDPLSGTEVARVSSEERVRDAYALERGLWIGDQSFTLLGTDPRVKLPPLRGIAGAQDVPLLDAKPRTIEERRVPFLYGALPSASETYVTQADTHYMVMPRTLVAMRTSDQVIRWLRKFDTEIIDAAPVAGGVVTCGKDGSVERVNSLGAASTIVPRGAEIAQCLVHAHRPMPSLPAADPSPSAYAEVLEGDLDTLSNLQAFALLQLGARGDEGATRTLLKKALDAAFVAKHDSLLREALLKVRGKQALLEFLQRDAIEPHVPIGTIALAFAALGERAALIRETVLRPETAERELPLLVRAAALSKDGRTLRDFFALYHVGERGDFMSQALVEAATGMLGMRSMSDSLLLRRAAADPETSARVRAFINEQLAKFPPGDSKVP